MKKLITYRILNSKIHIYLQLYTIYEIFFKVDDQLIINFFKKNNLLHEIKNKLTIEILILYIARYQYLNCNVNINYSCKIYESILLAFAANFFIT